MTAVWQFLSRTQGKGGRLSLGDWLSYSYLVIGFLVIFLPVMWILLNSFKSAFQLDKQDLSLLPTDFVRVARATVNDEGGKDIFIMSDLPDWVLNWKDLDAEERASTDVSGFLRGYSGNEFYVLRSHLGMVDPLARELVAAKNLPEWLPRYSTLPSGSKANFDVDAVLDSVTPEERRLLAEWLGVKPFKANKLISQILVTAPNPDTGIIEQWAVSTINPLNATTAARSVGGDASKVVKLPTETMETRRSLRPSWSNYGDPLSGKANNISVNFASCYTNSVLVTIIATIITLLINSMVAFALAKYKFRGQRAFFIMILATLMVPPAVTLVGVFKMITMTGLSGSIWGVIIPGAATPAGVFLLRQYMLTIPEELIEAARMDAASEWKVYWKIVLPLALPAIAALGILSVIWRWNDLIVPMVAIATAKEAYTIQLCLLEFRGEFYAAEHYRLAMTVVSLIPTTLVFVFLQRYITTGIANTGMK